MSTAEARFELRAVTSDDQAFLRALYSDVRGEEFAAARIPAAALESLLNTQFEAQRRHYESQYPGAEHLLILVDAAPAGRLWMHWSDEGLRVIDVSLMSRHRGRGIGTALLQSLQAQATARGAPIRLAVTRTNRAARLYARLGFNESGGDAVYRQLRWSPVAQGLKTAS